MHCGPPNQNFGRAMAHAAVPHGGSRIWICQGEGQVERQRSNSIEVPHMPLLRRVGMTANRGHPPPH